MFKRFEDQYKTSKASEMVKELNSYTVCTFSTVKPYTKILFGESDHSGTLVHKCSLKKGHQGKCKCSCEMEWLGF